MHYVIFPNYNEPFEVLDETLHSLSQSAMATTQVVPVLAMEAREYCCTTKARRLVDLHLHRFKTMLVTLHPANLPGEAPGKGSNVEWALQQCEAHCRNVLKCSSLESVVVTVADADSNIHPKYLSALTYEYCLLNAESQRHSQLFQAPVFAYRNWNESLALVRVSAQQAAEIELSCLSASHAGTRVCMSTFSASLKFFRSLSPYHDNYLSEDNHLVLKALVHITEDVQVRSIMLPASCYAVAEAGGTLRTLRARWTQAKRHALGVAELVYLLKAVVFGLGAVSWSQGRRRGSRSRRCVAHLFTLFHCHLLDNTLYPIFLITTCFSYFYHVSSVLLDATMREEVLWLLYLYCAAGAFQLLTALLPNFFMLRLLPGCKPVSIFKNTMQTVEYACLAFVAQLAFYTVPEIIACWRLLWSESFFFVRAPKPVNNNRHSDLPNYSTTTARSVSSSSERASDSAPRELR